VGSRRLRRCLPLNTLLLLVAVAVRIYLVVVEQVVI
jgi:hypothetical protein